MSFIRKGSTNISVLVTRLLLIALMSLTGTKLATAMNVTQGMMVHDAWARASIGKPVNSAGFLTIMNHGKADDRLIAVRSDISARVELHTHMMDGNIMKMRRVAGGIKVPAMGMAQLKPGGYHIMLIGLKHTLSDGDTFPLTLVFEKSGEKIVEIPVRGIGKSKMMDHSKMDHSKHQ